MNNNEAHIIQQILKGKTELYAYFPDTYGQKVFHLIVQIVSNDEDAQELTQDTFLKAFQHLSSFKQESCFSTWLYRIAYNTGLSAIRKKRFDTITMDEASLANISEQEVDDALNDESEEQLRKLHHVINRLVPDERALINLFYQEEKPLSEIALILNLTESNAKVKLYRLRKKLYVLIKQEE